LLPLYRGGGTVKGILRRFYTVFLFVDILIILLVSFLIVSIYQNYRVIVRHNQYWAKRGTEYNRLRELVTEIGAFRYSVLKAEPKQQDFTRLNALIQQVQTVVPHLINQNLSASKMIHEKLNHFYDLTLIVRQALTQKPVVFSSDSKPNNLPLDSIFHKFILSSENLLYLITIELISCDLINMYS